jgi:hypothetical protein
VVLGRPTASSITLSLLGDRDLEVRLEYGTSAEAADRTVPMIRLQAHVPAEVLLDGLKTDQRYYYRLRARAPGAASEEEGPAGTFHTARLPGSSFTFEIIGDSHPERPQQFDPGLYVQTLKAAAAGSPDFFMTIGDDFSVDTLKAVTRDAVRSLYLRQRLFLSLVGSAAPVFLVNGNHEQAAQANLDGTPDNVAVWAQTSRNSLFPQPAPDGFYTGDERQVAEIGLLRDYSAWTWGDALFVVIDPYWHSPVPVDNVLGGGQKTRDAWQGTIGDEQYAWLARTLEGSSAKYKFVFAHHVLGTGRGGIERAGLYEWGGRTADGRNDFDARRPGWPLPIHQLMVKNRVTAFVQGHDHIFASQVLDGIAYITLPEPADPNYVLYNKDAFLSGDTLPNSGRVRFSVSPAQVTVQYFREWLPADRPASAAAGKPAYSLVIPAGGAPQAGIVDPAQVDADPPRGTENKGGGSEKKGKG